MRDSKWKNNRTDHNAHLSDALEEWCRLRCHLRSLHRASERSHVFSDQRYLAKNPFVPVRHSRDVCMLPHPSIIWIDENECGTDFLPCALFILRMMGTSHFTKAAEEIYRLLLLWKLFTEVSKRRKRNLKIFRNSGKVPRNDGVYGIAVFIHFDASFHHIRDDEWTLRKRRSNMRRHPKLHHALKYASNHESRSSIKLCTSEHENAFLLQSWSTRWRFSFERSRHSFSTETRKKSSTHNSMGTKLTCRKLSRGNTVRSTKSLRISGIRRMTMKMTVS